MADKGPGSTGRSNQKRLARAKIKPTDTGINSSKGRKPLVEEKTKTQQKAERKKKITAIAIGIFAVIMALSMMLPSLSYIFGSPSEKQAQSEAEQHAAEHEATTDETTDDATDEEAAEEKTGIDLVDANYKAVVDPLEKKLEENPEDLATLLNLGNDYVSWASEASSHASDEAGLNHVSELYDKALDCYDRYLKLNDSAAVKTNRAMVQVYTGDFDAAIEALKAVTTETPEYGPAWVDLGMVYEFMGHQDEAKEAYQSAIEADPNDEYGSKSYASQRVASMAAQTTDIKQEDEATSTSATDVLGGASALEDALEKGSN